MRDVQIISVSSIHIDRNDMKVLDSRTAERFVRGDSHVFTVKCLQIREGRRIRCRNEKPWISFVNQRKSHVKTQKQQCFHMKKRGWLTKSTVQNVLNEV